METNMNVCWQTTDALEHPDSTTTIVLANERQQPVLNKKVKNPTAATVDVVHRVAASPRQMKTQIARVSYSPARPSKAVRIENQFIRKPLTSFVKKIHTESSVTSPQTANSKIHTKEEYAKRKYERHREIQEIQTMLKEIAKSPIKSEPKPSGKGKAAIDKVKADAGTVGVPTFRRSKTEWLGSRPKAASTRREYERASTTGRPRSRSSQPEATKSHELLPENVGSKKKSYNAAEARQFMEEQRRRRRSNPLEIPQIHTRSEKTAFEKEQIKKRLEELRKNSRKIVSKNVSKKLAAQTVGNFRKDEDADVPEPWEHADGKDISDKTSPNMGLTIAISYKADDTASGDKFGNNGAVTVQISGRTEKAETIESSVLNRPLKNVHESQSDTCISALKTQIANPYTNDRLNIPLIEKQKRIGLLRKPETKDHSFSAIREFSFDKENVALEMLTPKLTTSNTAKAAVHEQIVQTERTEIEQITRSTSDERDHQKKKHNDATTDNKAKLGAQSTSSDMHISEEKRTQKIPCEEKAQKLVAKDEVDGTGEQHDLPYWLKPSAVQIYPYNFIMAVRRKLEAIAEPEDLKAGPTYDKTTSTGDFNLKKPGLDTPRTLTSRISVPKTQKYVRRHVVAECRGTSSPESCVTHTIERNNVHMEKVAENSFGPANQTVNASQTLSDLNSNFSSISIQVPTSNSLSELSSIRSEKVQIRTPKKESRLESRNTVQTDDDTTISSSVFNSPNRKPNQTEIDLSQRSISPLSLERVENLKITSSSKLKKAIDDKHVTAVRGNFKNNSLNKAAQTKLDTNVDFSQLLDDFNRSLSQVIQVNEQLRITLDKSHQKVNCVNNSSHQDENTLTLKQSYEYSTDFEESADKNQSKNVVKQQLPENMRQKKSLFDITNVVKPLLASPKSDDSYTSAAQFEKDSLSRLDLNVSSGTNFSKNSSKSCKQEGGRSCYSQEQVVESTEPLQQEINQKLEVIGGMKAEGRMRNVKTNNKIVEDEKEAENRNIKSSKSERVESKGTHCVKEFKKHSKYISELNPTNNESCKNGSISHSERNEQLKHENEISAQCEEESIVPTEVLSFQQYNKKSVSASNKLNDEIRGCSSSNSAKTCLTESKNTSIDKSSNECSSNNIVDIRHKYIANNQKSNSRSMSECPLSTKRNSDSEVAHEVGKKALSFFQDKEKRCSAMSCAEDNSSSSISISPPRYKAAIALNSGATVRSHKRKPSSTVKVSLAKAINDKVVSLFQHSNLDLSALSSHNDCLSESSRSYTSIGLYEKLILNETTKSEHLTALLKLREKALLDRTKGQIAWLEIQKKRCKTKGLHTQIAAIKKKQRGILIKMEKEREDIKRLLQSTASTISKQASSTRLVQETLILPVDERRGHTKRKIHCTEYSSDTQATRVSPALVSFLPSPTHRSRSARIAPQHRVGVATAHSAPIVRATYELESSRSLEELLSKREADLRRRRQHVEQLMQWHRRLDQEETEVLQMEQALLSCHNVHEKSPKQTTNTLTAQSSSIEQLTQREYNDASKAISSTSILEKCKKPHSKMERRLKEIDKSLQELSTISSSNSPTINVDDIGPDRIDFVRTTGSKLNKLWRRLTSQQTEKFEANRRYELCKRDLEQIYEDAKISVLQNFSQNEEHIAAELLERSASTLSDSQTYGSTAAASSEAVPRLNLNFSSQQSDPEPEECSAAEVSSNSLLHDNYSPSVAEENFRVQVASEPSVGITASGSNSSLSLNSAAILRQQQIEQNMQTFLSRVTTTQVKDNKLCRSLSDTQLTKLYWAKECFTRTALSQHNVALTRGPKNSIETIVNNRHTELIDSPNSAGTQAGSICTASQTVSSESCDAILENSIVSEHILSTKEILPSQEVVDMVTSLSSVTSLSQTSVDCENKADTISANYEETPISDVEPSPSKCIASKHYQSTNSLEIKDILPDIGTSSGIGEQNLNSTLSCSNDFESMLMNQQATSDCTPEQGSLPAESLAAQEFHNENADSAINNQAPSTLRTLSFEADTNNENADTINLLEAYETDFESEGDETCIDDLSLPNFESAINTTRDDCESPDGAAIAPTQCMASVSEPADTLVEDSKESATQLMPDIINELEIRRCRQIVQKNEQFKQYEHVTTAPYMYVREIPNKPPPPYVPPAHGSPMTTIFPSEERIKDITYRRSHELYCEMLKTDYTNDRGEKLASVLEEKITNIYERIILDICREYLEEHHEVLTQGDPSNFHSPLAFFNPPDRLRCIQESIYKEVRRCLAMDKSSPKRVQVYSVYGQRAKRDHIGKIIIQEMYDEDDKWCSFHSEENEVLELIIEEIIANFLNELARETLLIEGGTIEEEEDQNTNENEEPCGDTVTKPIDTSVPSDRCQVAMQGQDEQSTAEKTE